MLKQCSLVDEHCKSLHSHHSGYQIEASLPIYKESPFLEHQSSLLLPNSVFGRKPTTARTTISTSNASLSATAFAFNCLYSFDCAKRISLQILSHHLSKALIIVSIQDSIYDVNQNNFFSETPLGQASASSPITTTNYSNTFNMPLFLEVFQ